MLRSHLRRLRRVRTALVGATVLGSLLMAALAWLGFSQGYAVSALAGFVATLLFPAFVNGVQECAERTGPTRPLPPALVWALMLAPGLNLVGAPYAVAQMGRCVAEATDDVAVARRIRRVAILYGINNLTPWWAAALIGFPFAWLLQGFANSLLVGFATQLALEPLEELDEARERVPLGGTGVGAPVAIKTT